MDFWKRARWICSILIVAVWLVIVAASWLGRASEPDRPTTCVTNCL